MKNLSDRLRLAMAETPGMTQVKLAKVCGVSQPSVNDWLSGKTKTVRGPGLLFAAAALGVNALWLGTGKGGMRPVPGQVRRRQAH